MLECVWVCLCVQTAALPDTLVHLLSLSPAPRCSQGDKFCHALICHTGCYLSPLPVCLLIFSLSSTGDIIHATEGEKEGSLSSAPERLQWATAPPAGEPRTEVYGDYTWGQLCNVLDKESLHCSFKIKGMQLNKKINNRIMRKYNRSFSFSLF